MGKDHAHLDARGYRFGNHAPAGAPGLPRVPPVPAQPDDGFRVEEETQYSNTRDFRALRAHRSQDMRSDYWNVKDEQVIEKTGKPLAHWKKVLKEFGAADKKPTECVNHLQKGHGVPRYWARTLTT